MDFIFKAELKCTSIFAFILIKTKEDLYQHAYPRTLILDFLLILYDCTCTSTIAEMPQNLSAQWKKASLGVRSPWLQTSWWHLDWQYSQEVTLSKIVKSPPTQNWVKSNQTILTSLGAVLECRLLQVHTY